MHETLEQNKYIIRVFIDASKAFDMVDHRTFLAKLDIMI